MAKSPGYGTYRYRLHLDHLKHHIEDITDNAIAIQWCERIVEEWTTQRTADDLQTSCSSTSGSRCLVFDTYAFKKLGWISDMLENVQ